MTGSYQRQSGVSTECKWSCPAGTSVSAKMHRPGTLHHRRRHAGLRWLNHQDSWWPSIRNYEQSPAEFTQSANIQRMQSSDDEKSGGSSLITSVIFLSWGRSCRDIIYYISSRGPGLLRV